MTVLNGTNFDMKINREESMQELASSKIMELLKKIPMSSKNKKGETEINEEHGESRENFSDLEEDVKI